MAISSQLSPGVNKLHYTNELFYFLNPSEIRLKFGKISCRDVMLLDDNFKSFIQIFLIFLTTDWPRVKPAIVLLCVTMKGEAVVLRRGVETHYVLLIPQIQSKWISLCSQRDALSPPSLFLFRAPPFLPCSISERVVGRKWSTVTMVTASGRCSADPCRWSISVELQSMATVCAAEQHLMLWWLYRLWPQKSNDAIFSHRKLFYLF